ncbi:MAG: ImmA/IrrE family metallo-endopeptidase [Deltaproteobacteria bacterium]|nr:ImmA/IrrE family metallo-endopeptidase [Deltaproteobacteria bacterium]
MIGATSGRGPAGLGFADTHRGPAVVLNTRGKNENPAVRRFSLAHELCLLSDWDRAEPLVSISGYLTDQGLDRERRANGFAARFLCPETVVHRLRHVRDEDAARVLIDEYGMHYGAARLYLRNEANVHLPEQPPTALRPFIEPDAGMSQREAMRGVEGFPLAEVPMERRGVVGETVMRAWSRGLIPRTAARFLGVTPVAEIETRRGPSSTRTSQRPPSRADEVRAILPDADAFRCLHGLRLLDATLDALRPTGRRS